MSDLEDNELLSHLDVLDKATSLLEKSVIQRKFLTPPVIIEPDYPKRETKSRISKSYSLEEISNKLNSSITFDEDSEKESSDSSDSWQSVTSNKKDKDKISKSEKRKSIIGGRSNTLMRKRGSLKGHKRRESWAIRSSTVTGSVPEMPKFTKRKTSKVKSTKHKRIVLTFISTLNLPKSEVSSPYIIFFIEPDVTYRTRTKYNNIAPLWNETFEIDYKSSISPVLKITLWNHVSSKQEDFIGSGFLPIDNNIARENTLWVDILPKSITTPTKDTPRLQVRYKILEMDSDCETLISLFTNEQSLSLAIYQLIEANQQELYGYSFIELFHSQKQSSYYLLNIISDKRSLPALLSKTSVLRKMIGVFCKYSRDSYLDFLQPVIAELYEEKHSLDVRLSQLSPSKNQSIETQQLKNKEILIKYATKVIELVHYTALDIIPEMISLFRCIAKVLKEYPDELRILQGEILFQKYICPVIASPISYGVVHSTKESHSNQSNIILAKLLVNMATKRLFPESNELSIMNDFILSKEYIFVDLFNCLSQDHSPFQMQLRSSVSRENFRKHLMKSHCVENLEFWEDNEKYKSLQDAEDRKVFAEVMIKLYFQPGSERELNVEHKTTKAIVNHPGRETGDIKLFNDAIEEIVYILQTDSFHKFTTRRSTTRAGQQVQSKIRANCLSEACKFCIENRGSLKQYLDNEEPLLKLDKLLLSVSKEYNPYRDVNILNRQTKCVKLPGISWIVVAGLLEKLISLYKNYFEDGSITDTSIQSLENSDEFKQFENLTTEIQVLKVNGLSDNQKIAFWVNIYNLLTLHAYISIGQPNSKQSWYYLQSCACYEIDGNVYSLLDIEKSILRASMSPSKYMSHMDGLSNNLISGNNEICDSIKLTKPVPYLSFVLCNGSLNSPIVKIYHPGNCKNEILENVKTYMSYSIIVHPEIKEVNNYYLFIYLFIYLF